MTAWGRHALPRIERRSIGLPAISALPNSAWCQPMDVPASRQPWLQFSIRGLLLATVMIAFGLSVGCLKCFQWEDGLLAVAAMWISIGLVQQIAGLWRTFRRATGLSPDQRFGWWFAILARAGLAMLLVGSFLLTELLAANHLADAGLINEGTVGSVNDSPFFMGGLPYETCRNAVLMLSFLIVLCGLEGKRAARRRRPWSAAVNLLAAVAIIVVAFFLLHDRFLVYALVHIACEGIALGMERSPANTPRSIRTREAWRFSAGPCWLAASSCSIWRASGTWQGVGREKARGASSPSS